MKSIKIAMLALLMGTAGIALAQSEPGLAVSVAAPASITAGTGRTLATIGLRAGNSDVRIESLPISLGFSDPQAKPFSDCALRNTATSQALNTGRNALGAQGSGDFSVTFDNPVTLPADMTTVLFLTCDISGAATDGSAVATSIFASQVKATSKNGDSVTVDGSDPQSGSVSRPVGVAIISSAAPGVPNTGGTGATPGVPNTGGTSATPGIPNTGGGGGMALPALLSFIVLAAGIGGLALTRRAHSA